MKTSALKLIIKEAVKEAIQEELKEILLEAVKTPRVITQAPITENINAPSPIIPQSPTMSSQDKRDAYKNILGDTAASFTSNNAQSFQPQAGMDTANGTLPAGEVDMNQILGLMNK
tara:strand:- start:2465 stop:2812 length:348 start_codon:yes stop_codon:yes gene_type:complete